MIENQDENILDTFIQEVVKLQAERDEAQKERDVWREELRK